MKPLNRMIAHLASVAHLLAACSSGTHNQVQSAPTQPAGTTTQSTAGDASATLPKAALDTSNLITGWPPDTPGLREVVFNFNVTGSPDRILTEDESGFLIIQSEHTSEFAKLVFFKGKRATYRIPLHRFKVYSIGVELLCHDMRFKVPEDRGSESEIYISIDGNNEYARIVIKGPEMSMDNCRTEEKWEELDRARTAKSKLSTGEKVALGIAGAIVLVPICIVTAGLACGGRIN